MSVTDWNREPMEETALTVTEERHMLNTFKSVYYMMNAKPDSITRGFNRSMIVDRDDIIRLNDQINEKIKNHYYEDSGYVVTVTVILKNKKTIDFSCWENFVQHEWAEAETINSIVIKWNFNLILPQYKLPQSHSLMVKITSGLRLEEIMSLILSGKIEEVSEVETNNFPIVARVDFIDNLIGEELLEIVARWTKTLNENQREKHAIIMGFRKYRKVVAYYFHYIMFAMVLILLLIGFGKIATGLGYATIGQIDIESGLKLLDIAVLFVLILCVMYKAFKKIAKAVFDWLEEYGRDFVFNITKGDQNEQARIIKKDKNNAKKIIAGFIFSLIFNIACSIITGLIV